MFENLPDCDGLVVVTNHDEFSSLNLELIYSKMKFPIVVDSRGLIQKDDAKKDNTWSKVDDSFINYERPLRATVN